MADLLLTLGVATAKAVSDFKGALGMMTSASLSMGDKLGSIGSSMTTSLTMPIVAGMVLATKAAVDYNSTLFGVARTLDLTKDETAALGKEVLTMAPKLGLLPQEFANMAAEAGKLGVAKDELASFGKVLANLSAISDVPLEEFTKKAGAIKTIFAQNTTEFERFGAAVNALDDKIGGTTPNILEFTARAGAVGKTMGLTAGEVAAFGSVFESVGIAPERASTAFNNFANKLFTINAATPKAKAAFESLGYSAETFGQKMSKDPTSALLEFLSRMNQIQDPVERSTKLIQIFGKVSGNEIATLATQSDKLARAFGVANDNAGNLAKMSNEVGIKMNDPAIQAKVLQSQLTALGIQLGSVLIPLLSQLLTTITPVAQKFSEVLNQNPALAQTIVIIGGAIAILGPLLSLIGGIASGLSALGAAFAAVSGATTVFAGVTGGLTAILTTVGSVLFGLPGLIIAVGAAVIALATDFGGCRTAILNFISTATSQLGSAFNWVIGAASSVGSNLKSSISGAFNSLVSSVGSFSSQFLNTLYSVFNQAVSYIGSVGQSFFNAGASLMSAFAQGIMSSANAAYDAVSSKVGEIRDLLPFSPAKEGPLSDLDKSGASFFRTFAGSLNVADLQSAINSNLSSLSLDMSANGSVGLAAQVANPVAGSSSQAVTYNQNISISAAVSSREIIDTLKTSQRDFLKFLENSGLIINRRQS